MGTSVVPAPAESEGLSAVQRIFNVFFAPSKTFSDLNRNNSWWPAWLLISAFAMIFIFSMQQKVGFEQVSKNEIAASPKTTERMEKLPLETRDRQMEISATATKWISYAFPITSLIVAVICAAVLMATFNFGLGAEIKFGTALAVLLYAWVPGILKSLLAAISLFAGADPEGFNVRNPAATNIGFFLSRTDHPALYALASSIDVFAIWYIILLGIGFSCVSKVKRGTATSVVAGWYILLTALGACWVALMS